MASALVFKDLSRGRTVGAAEGRHTNPVPRCRCIAVAGGRAREIGRTGKLK